jgi:nicotinamidase-related amidase
MPIPKSLFAGVLAATTFVAGVSRLLPLEEPSRSEAPPSTLRDLYGLRPPDRIVPSRTALILVDFQHELFDGGLPVAEAPSAAQHAASLLEWARRAGLVVVHVRNETKPGSLLFSEGSPGARFVGELAPVDGEIVVTKSMLGAFTRTSLHEELATRRVDTVIVAGLMTHLAVQVTASDAAALGYRTVVAADAVATRALRRADGQGTVPADLVQRVALAGMADRVADVLPNRALMALPLTGD